MRAHNAAPKALGFLLALVGFISITGCSGPSQQGKEGEKVKDDSPIQIVSAKRAKSYVEKAPLQDEWRLEPTDPQTSVVLILEIKGIPPDAVKEIQEGGIYVMAGEQKCGIHFKTTGIIAGKERIILGLVVPKDALDLRLFMGNYPPKSFRVETEIRGQLEGP